MKKIKQNINIIITALMLVILRYGSYINLDNKSIFYNIIMIITTLSIIYAIIVKSPLNKRFLIFTIGLLLLLLGALTAHIDILILYIFALLFLEYDDKSFVLQFLIIFYAVIFSQIVLFFLNMMVDEIHYQNMFGFKIKRYSLGLGHPNTLFLYAYMIFIYILYLNKKFTFRIRIFYFFFLTLIFALTASRTGYIISLITLLIEYVINKIPKVSKTMLYLLSSLFPLGIILSLMIIVFFQDNQLINSILSGRINLWGYYYSNTPLSLTGGNLVDNIYLDNLYLLVFYVGGLLNIVIYIVLFIILSIICYIENDKRLYIITIIIMLYSYTEATMINVGYIFIIPIVFRYLIKKAGANSEIQRNYANF